METEPQPPTQPASLRYWRLWVWVAEAAGLLVAAVAIVAGVRWLATPQPNQPGDDGIASLEAQWNSTIRRLGVGIEPVYPPQEDLTVGDVFATVIGDDENFPALSQKRVVASTPFLGRSVKLGHVDVSKELEIAYAQIPIFPETGASTQGSADHLGGGGGAALPAMTNMFGQHEPRRALPRAAFPGLTIYHSGSASAGVTAGSRGWLDFSANNEDSQKLILGVVETYGLDAVTATHLLTTYCENNRDICREDVARQHLRPLVGNVLEKFTDLISKKERYSVTIHLIMVSRVYLAREILEQRKIGGAEGGGVQAATQASGASASTPVAGATDPASTLEQRIAAMEKQLTDLQKGAVVAYRSTSGTDILLDQKFPRPVAIGYRSVPYEFAPSGSSPSN
jgi:hypothetical protein